MFTIGNEEKAWEMSASNNSKITVLYAMVVFNLYVHLKDDGKASYTGSCPTLDQFTLVVKT